MGIERDMPDERAIDMWLMRVAVGLFCVFLGGAVWCAAWVWGGT